MITADLISYIRKQQDNNISNDLITSNLESVGWHPEDIEEGFYKVNELRSREKNISREEGDDISSPEIDENEQSLADRYREPIDLDAEPLAKKDFPVVAKKKEIVEPKKGEVEIKPEVVSQPVIIKTRDYTKEPEVEEKPEFDFNEYIRENSSPAKKDLVDVVNPFNIIIEKNENDEDGQNEFNASLQPEVKEEIKVETKEESLVKEEPALIDLNKVNTEPIVEEIKNVEPVIALSEVAESKTEPDKEKPEVTVENEPAPISDLSELKKMIEQKLSSQNIPVSEPINIEGLDARSTPDEIIPKEKVEPEEEPLVDPILNANELESGDGQSKIWLPKAVPVKEIEAPEVVEEEPKVETPVSGPEIFEKINGGEIPLKENTLLEEEKGFAIDGLPKISPVSTYSKDIEEAINKAKSEGGSVPTKSIISKKLVKIIALVLLILVVGGGFAWALVTDKINISNLNIPFINKDPRNLIVKNSQLLASLNSYKAETVLELKVPSFANISAGLLTGEAVPSLDKDNLVFGSNAMFNKQDGVTTSDNSISISGTVLEEFINGRIYNDGNALYLNFPDLSGALKEPTSLKGSVKVNNEEFYLVSSLFGPKTNKIIEKINLQKIISSGVSSYLDQETLGNYDDLIKNVQITKKGEEMIKGINTLHYSINPDKELFKNLMKKIVEKFAGDINENDLANIDLLVSSTNVSSFDVWVGKGNNAIYQYRIVLDTPMTKILGFEDKSIGDGTMSISLKVTYFDFNVENKIEMPSGYAEISDFVKNSKIESVKNKVKEFNTLALNLKKVEKKYGNSSNLKGSCMNPVSGSLFSPTGHPKSAITPVSEISSFLNYVLGLTKGTGSCYSNLTDWSFSIPLVDDYENIATSEEFNRYYCIDSKGGDIEISTLPKGTICEQNIVEKTQAQGV